MQTLISVLSNFKDGKHSGEALSSDVQYRLLTQYVLAATRILRALLLAYVPYFVRHNTQGCYNVLSGFLNSLRTLSSFCMSSFLDTTHTHTHKRSLFSHSPSFLFSEFVECVYLCISPIVGLCR
jgi:hypothetical protein